ncbi:MAG TPA: helix-turn-helix transcriptional regulator [Candidatus Brocadiales bacterium]|nr:helix-turn-helix transcriptional regulator [Candidatus Brocadiales bacterium]
MGYRLGELGIDQTQLARRTGLARQYLCRVLHGKTIPRDKNLYLIAKGLECTVEYLQVETINEPPAPPYGGTIGDLIKSQELLWAELRCLRAELKELKERRRN